MLLTGEEFALIRPLRWVLREYGGKVYNSPVDRTSTRLFWHDFVRHVFAPKYAAQRGVTSIGEFDTSSPVMLTDRLELKLPTALETAAYLADNLTPPRPVLVFKWIGRATVLVLALLAFAAMLAVHFYCYHYYRHDGNEHDDLLYRLATKRVV